MLQPLSEYLFTGRFALAVGLGDLLRVLYQFPPLCSSVEGILLRVSCIFVADGAENRAKSRGFARSGALGLPG